MTLFLEDDTSESATRVELVLPAQWWVFCASCTMRCSVFAADEDEARRQAETRFGWTRDGDDIHCRRYATEVTV